MKRLALTLALLSALLMGNAFIPTPAKLRVPYGSCNGGFGCWVEFKPTFGAGYRVVLTPDYLLRPCDCFIVPDDRFAARYRLVDAWDQRGPLADTTRTNPTAGCDPLWFPLPPCAVEQ